jgi:hypothetical protein
VVNTTRVDFVAEKFGVYSERQERSAFPRTTAFASREYENQ